jgi:hypothetical protein
MLQISSTKGQNMTHLCCEVDNGLVPLLQVKIDDGFFNFFAMMEPCSCRLILWSETSFLDHIEVLNVVRNDVC